MVRIMFRLRNLQTRGPWELRPPRSGKSGASSSSSSRERSERAGASSYEGNSFTYVLLHPLAPVGLFHSFFPDSRYVTGMAASANEMKREATKKSLCTTALRSVEVQYANLKVTFIIDYVAKAFGKKDLAAMTFPQLV